MMRSPFRALALAALLLPATAAAQTTEVQLGGIRTDPDAPVEITADRLEADQNAGLAIFTGDVVMIQGPMRLTAPRVEVFYATDGSGDMDRAHATGGVTMTSGEDAAEGQEAVYTIADGVVVMTGDVLLLQQGQTIAGQRFTANLDDGTGVMEGRVAVVIPPRQDGEGAAPAGTE